MQRTRDKIPHACLKKCMLYAAYQEGRVEKNPTDFWYDGEIGFFDFASFGGPLLAFQRAKGLWVLALAHTHTIILPPPCVSTRFHISVFLPPIVHYSLGQKAHGKSSDEYLNYALNNRREWEARGMEVASGKHVGR